jgi:prepilin-type processing-associated H-X9-DG protein
VVGWWAPSGGRLAAGDVTMSAAAPINYRIPQGASSSAFQNLYNQRICAFGSLHANGANFAMGDGSTRFINQTLRQNDLVWLCVRNDGVTVSSE